MGRGAQMSKGQRHRSSFPTVVALGRFQACAEEYVWLGIWKTRHWPLFLPRAEVKACHPKGSF